MRTRNSRWRPFAILTGLAVGTWLVAAAHGYARGDALAAGCDRWRLVPAQPHERDRHLLAPAPRKGSA